MYSKATSSTEKATFSLSKFFKNTLALTITRGIDMVVMVIIGSIVARYLGPNLYGEYAFIISLVVFLFSFTYFGTERIIVREIAKNKEKADIAFGTALVVRWVITFLVISVILLLTFFLNFGKEMKIASIIAVVSEIALSSATLYGAAYQAFERMEYETILTFFSKLLILICLLIVIKFNFGFLFIFAALAIGNIFKMIVSIVITSKRFVKPRIIVDLSAIKDLLKKSFLLGVNMLIILALFRIDIFLLKVFKDNIEVSLFYAPHAFLLQLQILPVAFSTALFPFLSRSSQNNIPAASYGYEKTFKLFWIIGLYVTVLGILCGPSVINLIYGQSFIMSTLSFQILMLAFSFFSLHPIMGFFLISQNKEYLLIPGSAAAFLTNLSMALILIPYYGNVGASIASVFGYLVLCCVTLYMLSKYLVSIKFGDVLPRPVGALVLMVLTIIILREENIVLQSFVSSVVYGVSLILLKTFSEDEINIVGKTLKSKIIKITS